MAPSFDPIEAKMRAAGLSDAAVSAFKLNFDALAGGESGMVRKEDEDEEKKKRIHDDKCPSPSRCCCLFSLSFRSSFCSRLKQRVSNIDSGQQKKQRRLQQRR